MLILFGIGFTECGAFTLATHTPRHFRHAPHAGTPVEVDGQTWFVTDAPPVTLTRRGPGDEPVSVFEVTRARDAAGDLLVFRLPGGRYASNARHYLRG